MNEKSEHLPIDKVVESSIQNVKRRHYLGAANLKKDPTGGLSGYYRNLAWKIYIKYASTAENRAVNPHLCVYMTAATVNYLGAGNCGELSAALYLELFERNLTPRQKQTIFLREYDSKDAHVMNAYVMVGEMAYDIWGNKKIKQSRIKAEMKVDEKKHITVPGINSDFPLQNINRLKDLMQKKFAQEFAALLDKDRQQTRMYTTLDTTDTSEYALFATEAFTYLYNKFNEITEDPYFVTKPLEAEDIQNKIINDYVYLLEELRQDVVYKEQPTFHNPKRRKHSDEEVSTALKGLVANELFTDYVLAQSYRNVNRPKAIELLTALAARLTTVSESPLSSVLKKRIEQDLQTLKTNGSVEAPGANPNESASTTSTTSFPFFTTSSEPTMINTTPTPGC